MPKASRLTPEQWQDLIEYYRSGRTLAECGRVWGLAGPYIGIRLKKMGIKLRGRFEPSRPEKWEKAPLHTQVQNPHVIAPIQPEESPASEGPVHSTAVMQPRRVSSKRKIIAIADSDKKSQNIYEKEF